LISCKEEKEEEEEEDEPMPLWLDENKDHILLFR
jgi:hypothetical protein